MIQTGSYGGVHTTRRESLRNERDFFVQQGERVSEMNAIFFKYLLFAEENMRSGAAEVAAILLPPS